MTSNLMLRGAALVFWIACIALEAHAGEPLYADAPKPPAVPQKGGGDENAETRLVMGLRQKEFWTRLRMVVADSDYLLDYGKLTSLLQLDVRYPLPGVTTAQSPVDDFREDAADRAGRVKKLSYGLRPNRDSPSGKSILVDVAIDPAKVCIPGHEVQRVFGVGMAGVNSDSGIPPLVDGLPVGVPYAIKYPLQVTPRMRPLVFGISPGGCVDRVVMTRDVPL